MDRRILTIVDVRFSVSAQGPVAHKGRFILHFFCNATARCDGLRRICDVANTSQTFAKPILQKLKYFNFFAKRRDAMQHKTVSPWRTQDVFLDTVQKRCRSIRTRSCTTFLSGQNPQKCTPYCVTKRTSPFSRKNCQIRSFPQSVSRGSCSSINRVVAFATRRGPSHRAVSSQKMKYKSHFMLASH